MIVTLLQVLVGVAAAMVLVPVAIFFAEILAAVIPRGHETVQPGRRGRVAVVVPAHNEAPIIAGTVRSLIGQLVDGDRLVVVADNCSDETASVAAAAGAEVVNRADLLRRGKGYALDAGVRHLEADSPDTVIIVDADCQVAAGAIDRLARQCIVSRRPVQALYLMRSPVKPALLARIAEFAWVIKNHARPFGLKRLGLPCQLMGSGMAIPWSSARTVAMASGHIVEDLRLGLDLARNGKAPLFCPEAVVTSTFAVSREGVRGQRTRWEHGHLSLVVGESPRLLLSSMANRDIDTFALALDLSVPPLSLLTLLVFAVWMVGAGLYIATGTSGTLAIASGAATLLLSSVLLAWAGFGRQVVSLADLILAPLYAIWKLPLYVRFLVARQLDWIRTRRDNQEP